MKSGWIIRYEYEGFKALSEEAYARLMQNCSKTYIVVEEHWMDIERGMRERGITSISI